jgi:hypothetical protein
MPRLRKQIEGFMKTEQTQTDNLAMANAKREETGPSVHLFRGSPAVRGWSKYSKTDANWSLCGIRGVENASDDIGPVTCRFCLKLADSGDFVDLERVRMRPEVVQVPHAPAIAISSSQL